MYWTVGSETLVKPTEKTGQYEPWCVCTSHYAASKINYCVINGQEPWYLIYHTTNGRSASYKLSLARHGPMCASGDERDAVVGYIRLYSEFRIIAEKISSQHLGRVCYRPLIRSKRSIVSKLKGTEISRTTFRRALPHL